MLCKINIPWPVVESQHPVFRPEHPGTRLPRPPPLSGLFPHQARQIDSGESEASPALGGLSTQGAQDVSRRRQGRDLRLRCLRFLWVLRTGCMRTFPQ